MELREYQNDCVFKIRTCFLAGKRRVVLCLPTGGGKTAIFSYIVCEAMKRGSSALVVTDRVELLRQANGSFSRFGIEPELITAGSKPDLTLSCHVAMAETLSRRAEKYSNFIKSRDIIIFDEAHRATFDKLFPYVGEKAFVIGATATPHRQGAQAAMDEFYTDIVQAVDTPELIDLGYLAEADTYGIEIDLKGVKKVAGEYDPKALAQRYEDRKVYDGVIENYNRICPGTKALAFCSNIDSAVSLTTQLRNAGLNARHLDSTISDELRRETLQWFKVTPDAMLISVGILTTGFDEPTIETIILYRATTSLPLFLQMVGRGSRTTDTKKRFNILDFGNNVRTHNFWEAERVWSLAKKPKKKLDAAPVKECPKCHALLPVATPKCKYCGHEFKSKQEEKPQGEFAQLVLLPKPQRLKQAQGMSLEQKARMCKTKGVDGKPLIKWAWVLHNLTDIAEARYFIELMGFKRGWEFHNRERYKVFQNEG
jgi:superfamily II DNA or RNA helicase